ncbi:MAG: response regulator [Deltaproteobacteria bacterium]|nr:response regulator [Deltaproteobacteria bacterium]
MNEGVILLVEDNSDDEALARRGIEKAGLARPLVVVRDGEEALNYLLGTGRYEGRDVEDLPRVVLIDLQLPKIGGLEVLRAMRSDKRIRHVPVVILTSSRLRRDIADAYALGANSYVCKPLEYDELMSTIQQVAAYWGSINEHCIED